MIKKTMIGITFIGALILNASTRAPYVGMGSEAQASPCNDRCNAKYERCCRNTSPCPNDVAKSCLDDVQECNRDCR